MPKYVVVLPFTPLQVGDAFSVEEWPLHVTVLPNFQTPAAREDLTTALESACRAHEPVSVTIGAEELFGARSDIPVNVISDDRFVQHLHEALLDALEREVAFVLDVPEYARAGYRPHVTLTGTARATAGERVRLRQLALVDMAPDDQSNRREVMWTCDLEGDSS